MGVSSLPKTVTRQRRDCDSNPGPSAPESSTLTTRLPSQPTHRPTIGPLILRGPSLDSSRHFSAGRTTVRETDVMSRPRPRVGVELTTCFVSVSQ